MSSDNKLFVDKRKLEATIKERDQLKEENLELIEAQQVLLEQNITFKQQIMD